MKATAPHAARTENGMLKQLRNECIQFHETWAESIAADFSRQELDSYLDAYLPENGSLSRAHQSALELITMIDRRTGIRAKYEQQKRQAEELRRAGDAAQAEQHTVVRATSVSLEIVRR